MNNTRVKKKSKTYSVDAFTQLAELIKAVEKEKKQNDDRQTDRTNK